MEIDLSVIIALVALLDLPAVAGVICFHTQKNNKDNCTTGGLNPAEIPKTDGLTGYKFNSDLESSDGTAGNVCRTSHAACTACLIGQQVKSDGSPFTSPEGTYIAGCELAQDICSDAKMKTLQLRVHLPSGDGNPAYNVYCCKDSSCNNKLETTNDNSGKPPSAPPSEKTPGAATRLGHQYPLLVITAVITAALANP